jgi:uncharacterized protein (DUF3820 family)
MINISEVALPFGKYHGWRLAAVVASDPNYCRWLSKQPFVRREFPMLYVALKSLTLPPGRIRVVRVTRRTLGSCEVYTFLAERIVRQPGSLA